MGKLGDQGMYLLLWRVRVSLMLRCVWRGSAATRCAGCRKLCGVLFVIEGQGLCAGSSAIWELVSPLGPHRKGPGRERACQWCAGRLSLYPQQLQCWAGGSGAGPATKLRSFPLAGVVLGVFCTGLVCQYKSVLVVCVEYGVNTKTYRALTG